MRHTAADALNGLEYYIIGLQTVATCLFGYLVMELGEGTLMSKFWKGYKVGWKKWGKLFALSLLVSIIVGIISLLLVSPAIVITLLQRNASLSLLEGDAVNLPSLFPLWAVLILIISAFLLTIVTWIQHLPLAYLYASVKEDMEQEEKAKIPMI